MNSQPQRKPIVVVEDDVEIAGLIRAILHTRTDFEPVLVHDGSSAIEIIRSVEPHVVLLDVELPGMSGLEIYDNLKADSSTREIPVIFVTGSISGGEFEKRKIKKYIRKPFEVDELVTEVETLSARAE